ncbi:MAG: hypothetical protein WAM39_29810 [Bryobacteraceae bacterium]
MPASHIEISLRLASRRETAANLFVTLPFLGLFLVQLIHHQPWQDELNGWGMAIVSHNLPTLYHYVHYEGHPSLWYLPLWMAAHWTHSPWGMTCVQAVIGTGIYLIIGLLSPFSVPEKLLLFSSYFVSFEYTVISRDYGLCLLLVLVYAYVRARHPEKLVLLACLLGLIANTDMVGVILSGALVLEYAAAVLFATPRQPKPSSIQLCTASAVYIALLGFCVWSLRPAGDISARMYGHLFSEATSLKHLRHVVAAFTAVPLFPISSKFPDHFWGYNSSVHSLYFWLAPPFLVIAIYFLFRRQRNLLILIGVTAVGCIAFFQLISPQPAVRHVGVIFMAFVLALWLSRQRNPAIPKIAALLLAVNAVAGILAVYGQWHRPFSNASATAGWIRSHGLRNATLLGSTDMGTAGVAAELERPIYFLDCNCADTFILGSSRRDSFDSAQVVPRIVAAGRQIPLNGAILILTRLLDGPELHALGQNGLSAVQLTQFTGAEVFGEDFFLYRLEKPDFEPRPVREATRNRMQLQSPSPSGPVYPL